MIFTRRQILLLIVFCWLTGVSAASAHPWGGLVVDELGHVYFTFICPMVDDDHHACVWRIDADGALTTSYIAQRSPSDIILTRSPGRTLFAAERDNARGGYRARLRRYNQPSWDTIIAPTTDPAQFHIQAYAVDADGTTFFARDARLYQRSTTGVVTPVSISGTFDRIDAMAWGPEKQLYLLDQGRLLILAKDGTLTTLATGLKKPDPENLPFSGANILFDLAVDEEGTAYLAYYGNREVLKVSATGEVSTFLHSPAPWSPHGIDVYDGEVYVLESTVGGGSWWKVWERPEIVPRVRKVAADGSVAVLFAFRP